MRPLRFCFKNKVCFNYKSNLSLREKTTLRHFSVLLSLAFIFLFSRMSWEGSLHFLPTGLTDRTPRSPFAIFTKSLCKGRTLRAVSDAEGLIQYEDSDKVQGFFFFFHRFHIHNQVLGNLPSHMLRNKNVLPSVCF